MILAILEITMNRCYNVVICSRLYFKIIRRKQYLFAASLLFAVALSSCQSGFFLSRKPDEPQAKFKYDCESDQEFMTNYEYLRRNEHFGLSPFGMQTVALRVAAQDALSIAEQISAASPKALDNFKSAYEYALDKSGLNLSRKEASSKRRLYEH